MATMYSVRRGLEILSKYTKDDDYVCAEHDIFYAGPDTGTEGMSEEDVAELKELRWFVDNDSGSWAVFT